MCAVYSAHISFFATLFIPLIPLHRQPVNMRHLALFVEKIATAQQTAAFQPQSDNIASVRDQ